MKTIKNNYTDWELLQRVLSGEIPEEADEFVTWLGENEENARLYQELKEGLTIEHLFDRDELYRKICLQTGIEPPHQQKRKKRIFLFKYVAAMLVFTLLGGGIYWMKTREEKQIVVENKLKEPLSPGSKKALLLLDDGTTVELLDPFEIKKEDGMIIHNDTTGLISYQKQRKEEARPELHTIYVPVGGEYELILADGTHIHLNSDSKLTYPSFFEEGESAIRQVTLEGEAFFEVAKNGMPFIVKTDEIDVRVLGTSFNLSSYGIEKRIATTLVTGSVEIKTKQDNESYHLTPGNQLVFDKSSQQVTQREVDTDLYTSWTRGVFTFRNQTLGDIMSGLSRWYDFSVEYEDSGIGELRFTGSAEKKRSLSYVLRQIETVTNIKFRTDGNKVIAYR